MAVSPFRLLVTLLGLALLLELAVAGRLKPGAPDPSAFNNVSSLCVRFDARATRTRQVPDQAVGSANRPRLLLF